VPTSPLREQNQRIESTCENHSDNHKAHKSEKTHPLQNEFDVGHSHAASLFGVVFGGSKDHKVVPQIDRISQMNHGRSEHDWQQCCIYKSTTLIAGCNALCQRLNGRPFEQRQHLLLYELFGLRHLSRRHADNNASTSMCGTVRQPP
jgi:hypothetical protein